jgi:hypothetical protein
MAKFLSDFTNMALLLLRLPLCYGACTSIAVLVFQAFAMSTAGNQTWLAGKSQTKWGFSWENHQTKSEIYHQSTFDYQRALKGIPRHVRSPQLCNLWIFVYLTRSDSARAAVY